MDNPYKHAMEQLNFDKDFEHKTAALLAKIIKERRRVTAVKRIAYWGAAAACVVLAIFSVFFFFGNGDPGANNPAAEAPSNLQPSAPNNTAAVIAAPDERMVAVSSEYGAGLSDYMAPGPGEVLITEEVRRALEDEANKGAYFFVRIYVIPPQQYANEFARYIYNGRTIREWRELVDLSKGEYPYSEYNGDHGGNITEKKFGELQRRAKELNAQENYDAATAEYNAEIVPLIDQAREEWEQNEAGRLTGPGYDVFLMNTWTYKNAGEKESVRILAGVLSKEQLADFPAGSGCGYSIEWARNGDGVLDWEEYKAEN